MPVNTSYLGILGSADNLNTTFLPRTASEATQQFRSDISTAGELHATGDSVVRGTLAVTGATTLTGVTTLSAALNSASAISAGEATFTGGNFSSVITSTDAGFDFGSILSAANDTGMPEGAFRFIIAASGSASACSLAYRSGGTTYYIGSTLSEA